MSGGWKSIALTAVLAALASGVGAWAGAEWMMRRHETPSLHDIVHRQLDLTAEQDARLDEIEARFAPRRAALEAEVRAANRELAAAIAASKGDSPRRRRRSTTSMTPWAACRRPASPTSSKRARS